MTHPLVTAAHEFIDDETRRANRRQRMRMGGADKMALAESLNAIRSTSREKGVNDPDYRIERGETAVDVFGYQDSFDEKAATVITDILHAVASYGYSPQAVLNQAAAYYAEEM